MMSEERRRRDEALGSDLAGNTARMDQASSSDLAPQRPSDSDSDIEADAQASEPGRRRRFSFFTEMVVLFAVALTIALLIKSFVVQPFFIPSASMENTLLEGDKVLVNKLVYHLRPIQRGDIVVFNGAGSWDAPGAVAPASKNPFGRLYDDTLGKLIHSIDGLFGATPGQTDYIKRVIGVPGDHVRCCNAKGQITVNGVPLSESSYLYPGAQPSQYHFSVVVPPGRLWVMGDNRFLSADSRLHECGYPDPDTTCEPWDRNGTVPESEVIGRAFMIIWPPSRIRILPIPSTFLQPALHTSVAAGPNGVPPTVTAQASAAEALGGAVPLRPSSPLLPLAGGLVAAVPLTVVERMVRLRLTRRLRARGTAGRARGTAGRARGTAGRAGAGLGGFRRG